MTETTTQTIEEEMREVEREIENMERELAERARPITWGETRGAGG
jgi:sugar-specific transcriptional regulator TrmB